MKKEKVVIIGAGPAGLTAAYELLEKSEKYEVVVLEESNTFGGISRTVNYKGNRMDMGGHRFFSKVWIYVKFLDTFFVTKPYLNLFQFLHQFRNPVIYLV